MRQIHFEKQTCTYRHQKGAPTKQTWIHLILENNHKIWSISAKTKKIPILRESRQTDQRRSLLVSYTSPKSPQNISKLRKNIWQIISERMAISALELGFSYNVLEADLVPPLVYDLTNPHRKWRFAAPWSSKELEQIWKNRGVTMPHSFLATKLGQKGWQMFWTPKALKKSCAKPRVFVQQKDLPAWWEKRGPRELGGSWNDHGDDEWWFDHIIYPMI